MSRGNGKVAVVKGSVRGIGLDTTTQLAKKGYQALITGRDETKGKKIQERLLKEGLSVTFHVLDVSEPKGVQSFVDIVKKVFLMRCSR